jgi:DNA primase
MTTLKRQVRGFVLSNLNVIREEGDEFACLCPFHDNRDTPALYINKTTGLWHCFNLSCGKKGRFQDLVKKITGETIYVANETTIEQLELLSKTVDYDHGPRDNFEEAMDRIIIDYRNPDEVQKLDYLVKRGFGLGVLEHFEVGFSSRQNRIVIPVRDENYKVVGFIGRAVSDDNMPKYKYSDNFPRRNLLLNLCNVKQYDTAIIVEGSLDHLKVHQAGFPNVISTMGSTVSSVQIELMNKYFSSLILFMDNDEPGEKGMCAIMDGAAKKDIWVVPYPEDKKDPGEMSNEEIQNAINTRITHLEYLFNRL